MQTRQVYFFAFAITIVVAINVIFLSSHTTSPLRLSQQKECGFSLGKDTVDIGKLVNENKELPITIYNNEDSSLLVKDVVSSCGCILLNKKTFSIPSHDSATVNAIIQPRKSDAKGTTIHRTIAFRTNYRDPIKFIVVKAAVS